MNQLGDPIPEGQYILNDTLKIYVDRTGDKTILQLEPGRGLEITTSVQEGKDQWKIWYLISTTESAGTIKRAPKE